MLRRLLLVSTAAFAMSATVAPAATIVNLDGIADASLNGSAGETINLAAGTYQVTFTQAQFTAFSRWNSNVGCDGAGENCRQGWELSASYAIDGAITHFGDAGGTGNYGPTATPDNAFYSSAAAAFAAGATTYSSLFTLAAPGDVTFFIYDDNVGDNRGGISLAVTAVPEPAAWAMMIAGFGLIGGVARRRSRAAVTFA
ncbi:PEPxxWA-CTERM sorting domain-containing protein [Sphingomonas flavalba]|uniref:PEPxxWA-CTERM sorting domain-containing protein n=1 Tax=Sphingomonas flavalba TaxID=2559804 RepID=UPI001EF0F4EE|nr:PEPxxWA-CTERM sorting domain-containing protein [Sphingomonas flavalba]